MSRNKIINFSPLHWLADYFAKEKMSDFGLPRTKKHFLIFEVALKRYYLDIFELWLAIVFLLIRTHLALPFVGFLFAGSLEFHYVDIFFYVFAILYCWSRFRSWREMKKGVVQRLRDISTWRRKNPGRGDYEMLYDGFEFD